MNRFTIRLAIAAATFTVGVALVWLLISTGRQLAAVINSPSPQHTFTFENKAQPAPVPVQSNSIKLEDLCSSGDSLNYKGVTVTRTYDGGRASTVTISRGGKILAGGMKGEGRSCMALAPLLGNGKQQLIIEQFSGGAHCCGAYWVYELYPRVRRIFDGTRWDIGDGFDEMEFSNLDGGRELEFVQKILTFDYFEDMCYAESPEPKIIFKYDRRKMMYYPANNRLPSVALKGIREKIEAIRSENKRAKIVNKKGSDEFIALSTYRWDMYDILLAYIYAGKEREAWKFYNSMPDFRVIDKIEGQPFGEREVRLRLKSDPVYKFVYRR